jgi:hypothetical protein
MCDLKTPGQSCRVADVAGVGASIGLLAERAVWGLVGETEHRWGIAPVVGCTLGIALVGWSLRMWAVSLLEL